jgi:RNA polymerase sigma factor (sigma-70 family)
MDSRPAHHPRRPISMEALKLVVSGSAVMADEEVVRRVIAGEKGLYEILLRRYNQTLYRVVRGYLREEADVEDIMQETYLKVYEKLHQYKGEATFSTWLIRIGINEALQRIKRAKKDPAHLASGMDLMTQLPDHTQMNPEKRTMHHETRSMVEGAIDRLPEAYRTVYILRELEDMTNAEVATLLGITESNVKVRLHRAKAGLRNALLEHLADVPAFEFGTHRCDRMVTAIMERI